MSDFGDILNQIGQVVGTLGGNFLNAVNAAGAIQHGGLPQMLAQNTALWDDQAFRQQVGQPGFLAALRGGMAGGGFPQIGPDPNVQHAGYGNEGQLIGPTARTNIPPLSPYAQAEQAKAMRESQMGSMTPEMAAQEAARFGVGQPGGASRFVAQTPYGVATYGGTNSGLPQGDQPPDIRSHGGYDFENTPHGWKVVGKTGKGSEEPDLGVPVDTSGQPIEGAPPSAAPARAQGQAEPTADPVTVTGPITPQDYQQYHQALQRQVSQGQLTPDQANAQLFGLREAVTRPAAQTIASAQGGAPGPPSAAPSPAPPQAAPQAAPAPQPAPGSPPGLQLPPGARMKDGAYFVPAGMGANGKLTYTAYKPPKPPTMGSARNAAEIASGWAAGVDMTRGGAPATPEQIENGRKIIEQKRKDAGLRSKEIAMSKPAGETEKATLAASADIIQSGNELLKKLKDPNVRKWLGPQGHAAWWAYRFAGRAPNLDIAEFTTIDQIFGAEAVGRLAKLMGSRSKAIYDDLRIHTPTPWDFPDETESKIKKIIELTKGVRDVQTKIMTTSTRDLPHVMSALSRKELSRDRAPATSTTTTTMPPQGAPQPQGTPVEGLKDVYDLGPMGQSF